MAAKLQTYFCGWKHFLKTRKSHLVLRDWANCYLLIAICSDVVLLQQMAERPVRDLQQLGGAGLHAAGLLQSRLDERALDLGDILFEIQPIGGDVGAVGGARSSGT